MARTVFLHVGLAKTGTTYLQRILDSNRELLGATVCCTRGPRADHFKASLDLRGTTFQGHTYAGSAGAWDRLVDEVDRYEGPRLPANGCAWSRGRRHLRGDFVTAVLLTRRQHIGKLISLPPQSNLLLRRHLLGFFRPRQHRHDPAGGLFQFAFQLNPHATFLGGGRSRAHRLISREVISANRYDISKWASWLALGISLDPCVFASFR